MADVVSGAGNVQQQVNLTGNIKDVKTKQETIDNNGSKEVSVFVKSVKVYASDDSNQNGKVNGSEIKSGQNASIFDNSNITGENVKNTAFQNLNEEGKRIASQMSNNTLTNIKNEFAKLFDKFNVKIGGEKIKTDTEGITQAQVDSVQQSYDQTVKNEATAYANEINQKILQTYSEALSDIASEAAVQAMEKANDEAIKQDLNPKVVQDSSSVSETVQEDVSVTEEPVENTPIAEEVSEEISADTSVEEEVEEVVDEPQVYNVQKGDTWYGIVQAKYGITDHKQTMEIIRQLKAEAGVSSSATNIPASINLPPSVTLKDGTEIKLGDMNAAVDKSHFKDTPEIEEVEVQEEVPEEPNITQEQQSKYNSLNTNYQNAKSKFEKYVDSKGFFAESADVISKLWNNSLINIEGSYIESEISTMLNEYSSNLTNLESMIGQEDKIDSFNSLHDELQNQDIQGKVDKYITSTQNGAEALKTTTVVAASAAAAVATGGASLAATAAVAGATTMATRAAVEVAELATNNVDGDVNSENLNNIAEQAMVEGAISAATAGLVKGGGSLMGKAGSKAVSNSASQVTERGLAVVGQEAKSAGSSVVKSTTSKALSREVAESTAEQVASSTAKTVTSFKGHSAKQIAEMFKNGDKRMYRELALKAHPDKCDNPALLEFFKTVGELICA